MARWFFFILAILFGFVMGLFYTWQINPIDYTNADLDTIRVDYRTDYVLMVAEIYQQENSLNEAIVRLTSLALSASDATVSDAIMFAEQQGYSHEDIALMQTLLRDLQVLPDNRSDQP